MNILFFLAGLVVGILITLGVVTALQWGNHLEKIVNEARGEVLIVDEETLQERFKRANTIDDMTNG